jgi:DHA1 family multidrug resistance protein-like MFS transporter
MELFRESAVGQVIRYITGNKVLLYPEETEDFRWPELVSIRNQAFNMKENYVNQK